MTFREGEALVNEDEVDLMDYIRVLLKRRRLILFGTLVCVLSAWWYERYAPRTFKSEVVILVREPEKGEPGAPPTSYLTDILKSDEIVKSVAEAEYFDVVGKDTLNVRLQDFWRTRGPVETSDALSAAVTIKVRGDLVTIAVETRSPYLSAQIANTYIDEIVRYNRLSHRTKAGEQLDFAEQRLKEVKAELEAAENSYAYFLRRNKDLALLPEIAVERDQFQRDIAVKSELYSALLKQRETLRIEAKKEAIVVEIIHRATLASASADKKGKIVMLAAGVGLLVAVFLAFFLEYLEKQNVRVGSLDILKGLTRTFVVWRKL